MNNPTIPLTSYFGRRVNGPTNRSYSARVPGAENQNYINYIKEKEYLDRKFQHANNFNSDFITEKIGSEVNVRNRIPYSYFDEVNNYKRPENNFFYQKDFNDYDNLSKKMFSYLITPRYRETSTPIREFNFDKAKFIIQEEEANRRQNQNLNQEDYRRYYEDINKNIQRNNNLQSNPSSLRMETPIQYQELSSQHQPQPQPQQQQQQLQQPQLNDFQPEQQKSYIGVGNEQSLDIKEYQEMIRRKEEEALRKRFGEPEQRGYNQYSTIPGIGNVINNPNYNANMVPTSRYDIRSDQGREQESRRSYSPIISKIAKKNLITINPCKNKVYNK